MNDVYMRQIEDNKFPAFFVSSLNDSLNRLLKVRRHYRGDKRIIFLCFDIIHL